MLTDQRYITMSPIPDSMKVKEIESGIGDRETLIDPRYKKIDKYGRLQVGLDYANQEVLVLLLKPRVGDKEKWVQVGKG